MAEQRGKSALQRIVCPENSPQTNECVDYELVLALLVLEPPQGLVRVSRDAERSRKACEGTDRFLTVQLLEDLQNFDRHRRNLA